MTAIQSVIEMAANGLDRASIAALVLEESAAPARVLLAPWGEVLSTVGSFVVDEEAVAATIAAFAAHGTDIPIDYEHQTLGGTYSSPNGQAPAAGWIKALLAVPPDQAGKDGLPAAAGLWAEVEWTEQAAFQLRGRQYRYLSPVAMVRREDRRMVALHSAALTNKPAIVGMRPVAHRADLSPDRPSILRAVLGMDESAADDLVLVTAVERIRTLESVEAARVAQARVETALAAGKLIEAQRSWATGLAMRDPEGFDAWERVAPAVVPLGRTRAAGAAASGPARRASIEQAARAEYAGNRAALEGLCTVEAFVADAVRQAQV